MCVAIMLHRIKLNRGQISLEFSILYLAILIVCLISISYFLSANFTKDDKVINDVENAAKTSVILVNSGYNGIMPNDTITYVGISWSDDKKNIRVYISPKKITPEIEIKNFIVGYIYNTTKINQSEYNITVWTI